MLSDNKSIESESGSGPRRSSTNECRVYAAAQARAAVDELVQEIEVGQPDRLPAVAEA